MLEECLVAFLFSALLFVFGITLGTALKKHRLPHIDLIINTLCDTPVESLIPYMDLRRHGAVIAVLPPSEKTIPKDLLLGYHIDKITYI